MDRPAAPASAPPVKARKRRRPRPFRAPSCELVMREPSVRPPVADAESTGVRRITPLFGAEPARAVRARSSIERELQARAPTQGMKPPNQAAAPAPAISRTSANATHFIAPLFGSTESGSGVGSSTFEWSTRGLGGAGVGARGGSGVGADARPALG